MIVSLIIERSIGRAVIGGSNMYVLNIRSKQTPGPVGVSREEKVKQFHQMYVKKDYGCWEWIGTTTQGYGSFYLNSMCYASRASWIIHNGGIPNNLHVLHKCDNKLCVNPDHLYLGSSTDNAIDRKAIRYHMGELWLIERLVKKCERTLKDLEPKKGTICKMFKISSMTLWRMRNSKLWPCRDGVHQFNWNTVK